MALFIHSALHKMDTFIQRFIRWINSRNLTVWRRRSTSSVSPSTIPVSSNSVYKSESSSAGYLSSSHSSTRQVHFADDRGEPLECVYEIPMLAPLSGKPFDENLEEVYIDERNYVTGFLKVTNLKRRRKLFVKYTTNEWKTHKTVATRLSKPSTKPGRTKVEAEVNGDCDEDDQSDTPPCENVLTYYFEFKIDRTKANRVNLVVISTLDGVTDQRHDKSYSLHYPAGNATNGHVGGYG